jgi:hypothetical protein
MKNFQILFLLFLCCFISHAQWSDDPSENNRITPLATPIYDFNLGTANDGTAFITYTRPIGNIATFLQVVDRNGNMPFTEQGVMVSHETTIPWTQINELMLVDDDGNAIISVSDCRNSSGEDMSYTLYKVSPSGEMLWGASGVDLCGGMAFELIANMNIVQLEDGHYVCAWSVYQGNDGYIQFQKISKTGTVLWGDAVKIFEPSVVNNYPYLVNAGNNQVLVIYSRETGSFTSKNLKARKIDSNGANVWASDLSIFSGFFGYTPLWVNLRVISDNMGGAFAGWYDTRENPNKESTYVAHVKANGTLGFNATEGGVKIGYSALRGFFPEMYCDNENGFLYVTWRETSNDMSQAWQQMTAQKINIASGELMWNNNGIAISPYTHNHSLAFYSIQGGRNGNFAVFFTSNTYHPQYFYGWDINKVTLINSNGGYVWEDQIIQISTPVSMKGNMLSTPLQFNTYWLTVWGDEREVAGDPGGSKKLYMQRINYDGSLGDSGEICFPPKNVAIDSVTHNSAVVSWEGDADNYEVAYRIVDDEWISKNVMGAHTVTLENLTPLTDYQIRVRSICSADLISEWTNIKLFSTFDMLCEIPVHLRVHEITPTSALLSWEEGDEGNLSWDLRYRETSETSWNIIENLPNKTYLLEELIGWAYLWTVRAHCDNDQISDWAEENYFMIEGVEGFLKEPITVFASEKIINIINPSNKYIERIQLFSIEGRFFGDYTINSTDNVRIPTSLNHILVLVKIIGKNDIEVHKLLMR